MDYFVGGFYGNYKHYKFVKEQFAKNPNDTLWIVGNIFDGNDEDPYQCIKIYNDIMETENVKLIVGTHEYYHAMRFISITDKEQHRYWLNYMRELPDSGEPLAEVFMSMDYEGQSEILQSMINECNLSELIKIGDNYFYVLFGFPASTSEDVSLGDWQLRMLRNKTISSDFLPLILNDSQMCENNDVSALTKDNCRIICMDKKGNKASYQDGVFLLAEDRYEGTQVLGIDAAGFEIFDVTYDNEMR